MWENWKGFGSDQSTMTLLARIYKHLENIQQVQQNVKCQVNTLVENPQEYAKAKWKCLH